MIRPRFVVDLASEDGNAIVEFVFVAILITVPLLYLIVAVAVVQRAQLAVTTAAREAGRAFATSADVEQGIARAEVAARIAFTDAGVADAPLMSFVAGGSSCSGPAVRPSLVSGAEFTVCVRRKTALPAIPSVVQGRGVTTEGRFLVHVDDFRAT